MTIKIIKVEDKNKVSGSTEFGVSADPQPFEGLETATQAALAYISNGLAPLPLSPKSKIPTMENWPKFKCSKEDIPKWFAGEPNIAVLLGKPSGGIVDVDLDTVEAVALAPDFLPPSACVFGRESSRASHYEYRVEGPTKSYQWSIPSGSGAIMLLEFRSTGVLTTFPPSTHPSGEVNGVASEAYDSHTRLGKRALAEFCRACRPMRAYLERFVSERDFYWLIVNISWHAESVLLDRRLIYQGSEEIAEMAKEANIASGEFPAERVDEAIDLMRKHLPDLHQARLRVTESSDGQ